MRILRVCPLSLAAGRAAHRYILGDAVKLFLKKRGPLNLVAASGSEPLQAVRSGQAHLGVVTERVEDAVFASCELKRVRQVVVVPSGHRLRKRSSLKPVDLKGERLVVSGLGKPHRVQIETVLGQPDVPWSVAVEADGWELMTHFVAQGIAIAIVNDCVPLQRGQHGIPISGFPEIRYQLIWKRLTESERLLRLVDGTCSFTRF